MNIFLKKLLMHIKNKKSHAMGKYLQSGSLKNREKEHSNDVT